jgi:salicylate hydroxylase
MVPFMAQGACQAIEDAAVLARALDEHADVDKALDLYESARRPRTANIQGRSFANATTFHFADGPEQQQRDTTYAKVSALGDAALANFDWLYDFDAMREPWPTIGG